MYLMRTFDVSGINRIVHDPSIHEQLCDDNTRDWTVTECDSLRWIGVHDELDHLHGAFLLIPQNSVTVEIHTCLLPILHGAQAVQAGQLLLDLIFTDYKKAITHVPIDNRRAAWFAANLGFRLEGINRKSFLKDGQLLDQKIMGLTHEEYVCQLQQRQHP